MPQVPIEEYDLRVKNARNLTANHGMDALLVTDPVSYFYFSGNKPSRPSVFILPLEGEATLITWSGPEVLSRCYNKAFPSWVEDRRLYPDIPFTTEERVDWGIRGILEEKNLLGGVIAIELGLDTRLGIPVNSLMRLQEEMPKARFVDSGPVVWGCRMIKSAWEIDASRKACEIGGRAFKRCLEGLSIGISAEEIQRRTYQYYLEEGADLLGTPVVALGATGQGGTFQKGDVLYLDGGPSYLGYRMDFTRRAVFGQPDERQEYEHEVMWEILFAVMDRMKPGVPVSEIFEFGQKEIARRGLKSYSDHPAKRIGHGIGLESEPPSISATDSTVLEEGMILTPEPKIESVDGLVNPEEQIVITKEGFERLSTIPGWELWVVQ